MMRSCLLALLFGLNLMVLTACEEKGPMERAGEKADDAAEDVGQAVDDATDS